MPGLKITLHVGLPKTATTLVQHTLAAAKQQLASHRLAYPREPWLHHEIIKAAEMVEAGKLQFQARSDEILDSFAVEARKIGAEHVLISSEAIIGSPLASLERMLSELQRFFPDAADFKVLCYVREPIAFAASLGLQRLKVGTGRLADLYGCPWSLDIKGCLERHVQVFGRKAVEVRYLHPDHLKNQNVIDDFLYALGIPNVALPPIAAQMNQALSYEGAMVADALAELRPKGKRQRAKRRAYKQILQNIPGSKFQLPQDVQQKVVEQSSGDIAYLRDEFGIEIAPVPYPVNAGYTLPASTSMAIARLIERVVEGA